MIDIFLSTETKTFILLNEKLKVVTNSIDYCVRDKEPFPFNTVFFYEQILKNDSPSDDYNIYKLNQILKLPRTNNKEFLKYKYLLAPYFTRCYLTDTEPLEYFYLTVDKDLETFKTLVRVIRKNNFYFTPVNTKAKIFYDKYNKQTNYVEPWI